ncbi:MAG: 50S ribosomal protein L11 [Nanoarchaeota archaeon]|nr:50S ribosomal protein L11 [Nanoarchaeota archaeon]MBU0977550.1 50S ribosomal protein L11 [Nanoarchaeota archaeon]
MPKIKLIVDGGSMKPGPAVAQQLGPMGINLGKVIADVNTATAGFKGLKVPVELDVNPKTKGYTIEVLSPPMAELIKKELKLEAGSGEAGKNYAGNISFEQIVGIAKTKQPNLLAKDLRAAIKLAIGSCVSLGILIDNKTAKEIMGDVEEGKYDKEIKEEITTPSEEKKKQLDLFWRDLSARQEKSKKALAEAKAAEEEAKAAAAAAAPATGAAPAAGTGKAAAPAKEAGKKEAAPKKEAGKKDAKKK